MMRRMGWWVALIMLLLVTGAAAQGPDPEAVAQALVDHLVAGDFVAAASDFDSAMQAALPPESLQATWEMVLSQAGPLQQQLGVQTTESQGYTVVIITLEFEKAAVDLQIFVDGDGKVAGLYFAESGSLEPQPTYEPPAYTDPAAFMEREIVLNPGTDWELPGTLTVPAGDGPFPAVVLVHGSGPNDRDETIGPNQPFRDLAWGLASQGIVVLRYDKRTRAHGELFVPSISYTVNDETVDDAVAAAALLRETEGVDPDRVYVLGHSLGALMAPRIAQRAPDLAGIILLAGPTRPAADLVLEQTRYLLGLDGDLSDGDQAEIAALEVTLAATRQAKPGDDPATLLFGAPPSYWIDLNQYDPVAVAQEITLPMLILQGERDYQVTLTDLEGWSAGLAGRSNLTIKTYADLNHLFISGDGPANPDEYDVPGHVAETVIADIADWILNP